MSTLPENWCVDGGSLWSDDAHPIPQQKFQGLVGPVKHYPVMPIMLKDLSPFTLQLLSGVYIAAGLFRQASWKDHCWTMEGASPWVRELMSQKCFRDLNRVFFSDPAENPDDRLRSIPYIRGKKNGN
ncbi:hypothetical protein Pelo_18941 [Pelomyxa schiedti]|nr:hypothetical protein Pelo_18941 [Pelomyxa schiedti]